MLTPRRSKFIADECCQRFRLACFRILGADCRRPACDSFSVEEDLAPQGGILGWPSKRSGELTLAHDQLESCFIIMFHRASHINDVSPFVFTKVVSLGPVVGPRPGPRRARPPRHDPVVCMRRTSKPHAAPGVPWLRPSSSNQKLSGSTAGFN